MCISCGRILCAYPVVEFYVHVLCWNLMHISSGGILCACPVLESDVYIARKNHMCISCDKILCVCRAHFENIPKVTTLHEMHLNL